MITMKKNQKENQWKRIRRKTSNRIVIEAIKVMIIYNNYCAFAQVYI